MKYTFPTESKFSDRKFAEAAYGKAVNRVVRNGTTTACYFATIHTEASLILADIIENRGQRGFVGKVNMDRNAPDYYIETTASSIADTKDFVELMLARESKLVTPVITPRFVPTCTGELMAELGKIAQKYSIPIQSHLSESKAECSWVQELHPGTSSYTDV